MFCRFLGSVLAANAGRKLLSIQFPKRKESQRRFLYTTMKSTRNVGRAPSGTAQSLIISEESKDFLGELRRYIESVASPQAGPEGSLEPSNCRMRRGFVARAILGCLFGAGGIGGMEATQYIRQF